ncbi:LarC family nickel insertion protein [Lactiplantibacillus pentosus]|uniref:LarC family nickel insertion protein n=1 Tax=Lactiplantibacillus pentosus TaxID=1589 RepID=UPI0021821975|nr:LarC family nickel insertion protein [Lactiplantibacillus pentosus]MCS8602853.1 LarC family nickel insertion protein [Lactiplantibacillus pentosus]
MQTLYLDAFSGISGDMFLGALLDLGLDFEQLKTELAKLHVHGYELTCHREAQSSIYGTSFDVQVAGGKDHGFVEQHHEHGHHHEHEHECEHKRECDHDHKHDHDHVHEYEHTHEHDHAAGHHHDHEARHLADIEQLIDTSDLSDTVKHHAKAIFMEIAQAEAAVHHMPLAEVHFHEVGALDSIVDIVGCCVGLELMQIDTILSSPLSDGSGFINVAHGQMPVPVPAVMQMRVGSAIPIQQRLDVHTELITPTGMGIVKTLVQDFGPLPERAVATKVGYGFGKRDTGGFNALRAVLFEKKN